MVSQIRDLLFDADEFLERAENLFSEIDNLAELSRVEIINELRRALHRRSPFSDQPVDCVIWVDGAKIVGNDYNPNTVAPPEMRLLQRSITADGYTQPIVTMGDEQSGKYTVVDGFHRTRVGKECGEVKRRLHGFLPIAVINQSRSGEKDRMAATIRHNRARGVHGVQPMTSVVSTLLKGGWNDSDVATELGMDADEVLRFKQTAGLPGLFSDHPYSMSWE